jgi:hypothetical protein
LTSAPVTRADVIAAYRLLLGRNPESEAAIGFHLGKASISDLRAAFLRSNEFQALLPELHRKTDLDRKR